MNRPAIPEASVGVKTFLTVLVAVSGWAFAAGQYRVSMSLTSDLAALDERVVAVEEWRAGHRMQQGKIGELERKIDGLICDLNDVESFRCDAFLKTYGGKD